jgi:hypothetical protein
MLIKQLLMMWWTASAPGIECRRVIIVIRRRRSQELLHAELSANAFARSPAAQCLLVIATTKAITRGDSVARFSAGPRQRALISLRNEVVPALFWGKAGWRVSASWKIMPISQGVKRKRSQPATTSSRCREVHIFWRGDEGSARPFQHTIRQRPGNAGSYRSAWWAWQDSNL